MTLTFGGEQMNIQKLKSSMVLHGLKNDDLLDLLHEKGVKISRVTWYKRLNGSTEFTRSEISALAEILQLEEQEIIDIFFNS